MRIALAAAALVVALSFPAYAAPAACQFTLPDTVNALNEQGVKYMILEDDARAMFLADLATAYEAKTGQKPADMSGVTNVLIAILDKEVFFGLEVDGCLTGPAPLADYLPPEKRSGLTPVGTFA